MSQVISRVSDVPQALFNQIQPFEFPAEVKFVQKQEANATDPKVAPLLKNYPVDMPVEQKGEVNKTDEKLASLLNNCFNSFAFPDPSLKGMVRAVYHRHKSNPKSVYITPEEFTAQILKRKQEAPLSFVYQKADEQGRRPLMEDATCFMDLPDGVLIGVFDGHGGPMVSNYASTEFPKRFSDVLNRVDNNCRRAFKELFEEIHQEVLKKTEWKYQGSTAVISYIERKTGLIYTATLGDSEANIYRAIPRVEEPMITIEAAIKTEEERLQGLSKHVLVDIPLSEEMNWLVPGELARARKDKDVDISWWERIDNPKRVRYPFLHYGVNVSRAIGDAFLLNDKKSPTISHTPRITVNQCEPDDILLWFCDGVGDFANANEVAQTIDKSLVKGKNIAEEVVKLAYHKKHSTDNITVCALKVVGATRDTVVPQAGLPSQPTRVAHDR